jgi:hypothetical protein
VNSPIGICFICGGRLVDGVGKPTPGVRLNIDGNPVRAHRTCAESEARRKQDEAADRFLDRLHPKGYEE